MVSLSGVGVSRDMIHAGLKKQLLGKILPGLFHKYAGRMNKAGCYMVVVGGMSVERCANLSKPARYFLRDVFSEDIDIKCVLRKGHRVKEVDDVAVQAMHEVRMDFLQDVVAELKVHVSKIRFDDGVVVQVEIDDSLLNSGIEAVRVIKVVSVSISYTEGVRRLSTPIVDTGLYTNLVKHYNKYSSVKGSEWPIPVVKYRGVPYASCNYTYYDTVRMFLERINYFKEKKSVYALIKFYRNVVKFMSLYVLRHKIKTLPKNLDDIYLRVHESLMKLDLVRIKKGMRRELSAMKYDDVFVEKIVTILREVIGALNVDQVIQATVKEIQLKYAAVDA